MIWDWSIFLAGVGLGALIYTPLGMWFIYYIIKIAEERKVKGEEK